jgi:ribose transport system permease protein
MNNSIQRFVFDNVPVILLIVIFLGFSILDPRFLNPDTLISIARSAAYIGIIAVGMTLVLMTAGIDLSVGSVLYLVAVVVGQFINSVGVPVIAVPFLAIGVGLVLGSINGFLIAGLRIVPFIATLAMLTAYRGIAWDQSNTREVNYPPEIGAMGADTVLGIPLAVWIFALVVLLGHLLVTRTEFGRQILATGANRQAAEKAGIPVRRVLFGVYAICGGLVGLSAFVAMTQLRTAAPGFGTGNEFDAIAAAVLGGTSLFGGRGSVFPGTVVGALLIQMVKTGLVFLQVDLYFTPMVQASIILLAVWIDAARTKKLEKLRRSVLMLKRDEGKRE